MVFVFGCWHHHPSPNATLWHTPTFIYPRLILILESFIHNCPVNLQFNQSGLDNILSPLSQPPPPTYSNDDVFWENQHINILVKSTTTLTKRWQPCEMQITPWLPAIIRHYCDIVRFGPIQVSLVLSALAQLKRSLCFGMRQNLIRQMNTVPVPSFARWLDELKIIKVQCGRDALIPRGQAEPWNRFGEDIAPSISLNPPRCYEMKKRMNVQGESITIIHTCDMSIGCGPLWNLLGGAMKRGQEQLYLQNTKRPERLHLSGTRRPGACSCAVGCYSCT